VKRLLILLHLVSAAMVLFAQQPQKIQRSEIIEEIGGKSYYIHLVREGQTLQGIASAYQVSISEINDENTRFKGDIGAGDVIKIPLRSNEARQREAANDAPATTPQAQTGAAQSGSKTHTVLSQETFFGIARRYDITVPELRAANPGVESLQPGQILHIPSKKAASQPPATSPSATERIEPSASGQIPETYTAQAGETLFSISGKFGFTVEELINLNPELSEGLKAGQTIRLRKKTTGDTQFKSIQDTITSYTYHRVRRGETLFGIGREYGIGVDDILENNPHLIDGLQPRQVLKIPVYEIKTRRVVREVTPVEPVEVPTDTVPAIVHLDCYPMPDPGKVYNIALMVPFFLDPKPVSTYPDTLVSAAVTNQYRSYEFMQFYYGAMLAIDSLGEAGLNAKVFVYDVDNSPESIIKVLEDPDLPDMDLIIGPLFANSFDQVAKFAREHQIRIINPLSARREFLLNNPYAIKAQPSAKDQVNLIASYIKDNFADHNIIVVRQFSFSETASLEIFKRKFTEYGINEVIYIRDSLEGVRRNLDSLQENIIIGLSTDKVFIMDLVRKLNDIRSTYQITCFGMQEWEDFALDTDHIVNLQLHLPAYSFIDYDAEPVKQFIRSFRAKYNTEPLPGRFAFSAFDVTWYFVNAMVKFGEAFDECLPSYHYRGLQLPFTFEPHGHHGMENKGLTIYRLQNFSKVEVYPNHY
jgi:LysM repeat protein/ABC-type branched-subunit amino acid transport system substrate-binding protein